MSEEQKPELIECPGSFLKNQDYMFEQVNEDKFIFWDKKINKKLENAPDHNFTTMPDCPWKLASQTEEYESEEKLWHEIKTFMIDHVFLPDERLYDVLVAWVKATWLLEKWEVIPYLLIKGPMSCGKTRLLETLEAISYRGIRSANMSCSALFRALEQYTPTLFLDEVEIYRKEEYSDVSHLLNAGYRRGEKAWRVEHSKEGMMRLRSYDVFGMKAMAGTQEMIATLQSRSIIIDMVKNIKRVNFRVNKERALQLRNRLLLWRFRQLSTFSEHSEDSEDSDRVQKELELTGLEDGRLMELFDCLLQVSNDGSENILAYAKSMKEDRESEDQTSLQYQCLDAIGKCKDQVTNGKLLAKTIRDEMNKGLDEKEKFTTRYVLRLLSDLGFKKTHTKEGNGVLWNQQMFEYRLRQYKNFASPSVSSLSSQSSPDGNLMEFPREDKILVNEESSRCCENCGVEVPEGSNYKTTSTGVLCVTCANARRLDEEMFSPNLYGSPGHEPESRVEDKP